jgi:hypothetical protein
MPVPTPILSLALMVQVAQPAKLPTGEIPMVSPDLERPVLDGRLDEPFWGAALSITDLRQSIPIAGARPTENTEVLLAYDPDYLYVAFRCFDKDPSAIRATQMARDANLDPDDRVEFILDTFDDDRNGYWFQLGAAGSKGDALITSNGSSFNKRWDTIWNGIAAINDEGWFGEIRIPFASINFSPEKDRWGFNIRRHIRRRSEEARWATPDPRFNFFQLSKAGKITGLIGMRQGLGLDVVPFFVGAYENKESDREHWLGDAGFDVFYRITPNTKLSLSFNTDFAQTEVDERRVNLSRFALFFPEKRKFFLEDSGIFAFGRGGRDRGNDPVPFFSRRIGLDSEGNEVPLRWNAKITSTGDGYRFGLLDSQTDAVADVGARNLFVGRFSKNIFEQSTVGLIYTHGNPSGPDDTFTAGADLNLRTDDFLGDSSLQFSGFVLGTQSELENTDNLSYSAALNYPNDQIQASARFLTIEENFNPALGFVRRQGIREYEAEFSYQPRINRFVRQLRFEVEPRWITNMSGVTESRRLRIVPLGVIFESGDEVRFSVTPQEEVLDEIFEIQDPVTIPSGDYDFTRYSTVFESSDKRALSTELRFTTGTYFNGTRNDYEAELSWRANRYASLGFEYEINEVDLVNGDFDVNIASAKLDLVLNPRASWSNFVQWDDVSDNLGLNSRMRFIFQPGQDLFIVLNQGWTTFDSGFAPTTTDLRFKLSYTFRF